MNIRPVDPSCSTRTDGKREVYDETNSRLLQFWNAPKKQLMIKQRHCPSLTS